MPRIPRLRSGEPEGDAPQEQPTSAFAPGEAPTTQLPTVSGGMTSGDPLAAPQAGATALPAPDATAEAEATAAPEQPAVAPSPGFAERTRMRRRLRYLRRLRELAFRDLGGLVFDLHRFGRERGDLVDGKLGSLTAIDTELRALETALDDRRTLHELREPGIAACPRCATLHGSDANFCPGCGTPLRGTIVRSAGPVTIAPADAPDANPTPEADPAPADPAPAADAAPTAVTPPADPTPADPAPPEGSPGDERPASGPPAP